MPASESPRWRLASSDEFLGAAGAAPDTAAWVFDRGGEPQWGNEEWQYYTDRPENVALDGQGHLAITARREQLPGMADCQVGSCDITSGRITTQDTFTATYGRFEARIKIPSGQGMWPAFWMLGTETSGQQWPDSGEIDVMEIVGDQPDVVHGTLHARGYPEEGITGDHRLTGGSYADDFHTYAVDWSPDEIVWLVDGTEYLSVAKDRLEPGQQWPFDHPFYLLLNLAVGGTWPGPPDSGTPLPARMLVDYVRVYALDQATGPTTTP